jgi:hypothetical protein
VTAKAGGRASRPARHHLRQDPGNLTSPGPASPTFRSTAEVHNRLTEDSGHRPGSSIAVAGIALGLLLLTATVIALWPPA